MLDWDSCIADGACIEACSFQIFHWYRSEQDLLGVEMTNATTAGIGENHDREGGKEYTDKSYPIRENDCIWCMACVTVCPTQAIQVDEANLEVHKKQQKQQVKQVCLVLSSIM